MKVFLKSAPTESIVPSIMFPKSAPVAYLLN